MLVVLELVDGPGCGSMPCSTKALNFRSAWLLLIFQIASNVCRLSSVRRAHLCFSLAQGAGYGPLLFVVVCYSVAELASEQEAFAHRFLFVCFRAPWPCMPIWQKFMELVAADR